MSGDSIAELILVLCLLSVGALIYWAARRNIDTEPVKPQSSHEAKFLPLELSQDVNRRSSVSNEDAFDSFMREEAEAHDAAWKYTTIAGVTKQNRDRTSRQRYVRELTPYQELSLIREADNRFSSWAVMILDDDQNQVGYVPDWLARDISRALDEGGYVACYVQDVGRNEANKWGASIGILWRHKLSPRNEFKRLLDKREDVELWFWAKVIGIKGSEAQAIINALVPDQRLSIRQQGGLATLCHLDGTAVAKLSKPDVERILSTHAGSMTWQAIVFEVREKRNSTEREPVIAVLLLKH